MIKIRPYRGGPAWEYDIRLKVGGKTIQERRKSPVPSPSGTKRWAEERQKVLIEEANKPAVPVCPPAPTVKEFAPTWVEGYARAEKRQKPSEIASKESIIKTHLVPLLGSRRLDQITPGDVLELKRRLADRSTKTMNNVMAVLGRMLGSAVEWNIIAALPCPIRGVKLPRNQHHPFYDVEQLEDLVEAAAKTDRRALLIVLLGAEAGLRAGEMRELQWTDVTLKRRQLVVSRALWMDQVGLPKSGRCRTVPLTSRLAAALKAHKHLVGPYVLCYEDGKPLSIQTVRSLTGAACRVAGMRDAGIHVLRHTFCSHLAMAGAPARAIQELAGHVDLGTTQGYMHLSPGAIEDAIRTLETRGRGENREKDSGSNAK